MQQLCMKFEQFSLKILRDIANLFKKKTIILCSPSRAYYRTDFDVFGLKMTVKKWSMILPRKIEVFKFHHCKKSNFRLDLPVSYARKIMIFSDVPEKFWKPTVALPLFVDLFIQIVDTSAIRRRRTVSSIFVILKIKYWFVTLQTIRDTASLKKKGGEGAVLACNPPSPPPGIGGII